MTALLRLVIFARDHGMELSTLDEECVRADAGQPNYPHRDAIHDADIARQVADEATDYIKRTEQRS